MSTSKRGAGVPESSPTARPRLFIVAFSVLALGSALVAPRALAKVRPSAADRSREAQPADEPEAPSESELDAPSESELEVPPGSEPEVPPQEEGADTSQWTRREGRPFTGGFMGLEGGIVAAQSAAAKRAGIGPGVALGVSAAGVLWDQVLIGVGGVFLGPSDRQKFSELVVSCAAQGVDCSNPREADSSISGGQLRFELGYQHRFRPVRIVSMAPGLWLGYAQDIEGLQRGIPNCNDCSGEDLNIRSSGAYVAPFVRATFGGTGAFALSLRSQWFVTGDLLHMTLLGLEFGEP